MDNKIVSHICSECKGFVDPGMQKVIDDLRRHNDIPRLIAAEVLSNSNEHAAELLRVCECNALIPGTNWADMGRAAEFYGMSRDQFYTQLVTRDIIASKVECDVVNVKPDEFLNKLGLIGGKFSRRKARRISTWSYTPAGRYGVYKFNAGRSATLVSARVVLAVAALKSIGSYRVGGPNVARVYEVLFKSSYGETAQAVLKERMKAKREKAQLEMAAILAHPMAEQESTDQVVAEAKNLIAAAKAEPSIEAVVEQATEQVEEAVPETPHLSLTFDELTAIIKAAVREVMAEGSYPAASRTVVLTQ